MFLLSNKMIFIKYTTKKKTVVMGANTFRSLPK
ncbi:MAG TPA: hypothetical protein IAA76_00485 [Candidatus Ornithospirochaeta stercorigallinarum]|nr:hypothetical protein [Candidatus Ornithospirochaeta stercorigallinarum]